MTTPRPTTLRRAGIAGIVGGAATAASGLLVQGFVQPTSTVPDTMWSYPWSSEALVPVSIVYSVLHALVFVGVLGFARSGVTGASRAARFGSLLALAGTALYVVAELASIPTKDQPIDSIAAGVVGTTFGVATGLSAIGFLVAGVATLRARSWRGWRRVVPLVTGLWLVAMIGLAATKALGAGVGIYGLCILVLGVALLTEPTPSAASVPPIAARA